MKYVYDDGGRAAAGFKGKAGDCVEHIAALQAIMAAEGDLPGSLYL